MISNGSNTSKLAGLTGFVTITMLCRLRTINTVTIMEKELDELIANYEEGNMTLITLKSELLRLFNVSNSVKIALLEQLEELSEHIPCEVYTKKVIEIKSNFNDCYHTINANACRSISTE
jgi:hypothetical protein